MLPNSRYTHSESWKEYFYQKDFERNDTYSDYNLLLGDFYYNITQCTSLSLLCTIEEDETKFDAFTTYNQEVQRKMSILQHAALPLKYKNLVLATDQFLVKKGKEKTDYFGFRTSTQKVLELRWIEVEKKKAADLDVVITDYFETISKELKNIKKRTKSEIKVNDHTARTLYWITEERDIHGYIVVWICPETGRLVILQSQFSSNEANRIKTNIFAE